MTVESQDGEDMKMDMGAMLAAIWARKFRILLVTALLLVATYALLMFVPKMYESAASLLVESRDNSYTRASNDTGGGNSVSDEATISSQIELIKSRDTLLNLIRSEKLDEVTELNGGGSSGGFLSGLFGKKPKADVEDTVVDTLNERLTVLRERDSNIISLYVRAQDPVLAARISNALATTYVARRANLSLSDTAEASVWLNEQVKQLRVRVTDAENKVASFKVENDLLTGAANTSLLDQQLSTIASQISAAQERKNTAQSRSSLIRGLLAKGQPLDGVPDIRDSVSIQQLSQTRATLQGERAQKSATLLANHPTIRALAAQIAEIDKQIALEGRQVADALDAETEIEAGLEASLQADMSRLKSGVGIATKETVNLNELEREAKAERDVLESYLLRYRDAVSRTDVSSALPDVRVVTMAVPSSSPASPKTTFILTAVGIVSMVIQVGAILFGELLSGRALTSRYATAPLTEPVLYAEDTHHAVAETVPAHVVDAVAAEPPQVFADAPHFDEAVEPEVAAAEPELPIEAMDEPVDTPEPVYASEPVLASPVLPQPIAPMPKPSSVAGIADFTALASDVAMGNVRVVMLSSVEDERDSAALAEALIADALHRGLSVARVDAGSGRISAEPGLTDLSSGVASFGDVVHKSPYDGLAEVPWGHQSTLDRRSMRPFTLVEALTDIYELVVVLTGRTGMASALPVFAGIECQLILAVGEHADERHIDAARADAAAIGFGRIQPMLSPLAESEVA